MFNIVVIHSAGLGSLVLIHTVTLSPLIILAFTLVVNR